MISGRRAVSPATAELHVKGLDAYYSAAYMSQTQEQQRFTVSKVAADWHELMIPQRIMRPSSARPNGQLDTRCS